MEGDITDNSPTSPSNRFDSPDEAILPAKLTRSACIFDCDDKDPQLNSPKDRESWERLLKAAEIRKHKGILRIAATVADNDVPQVLYHRNCRNRFTLKRELNVFAEGASAQDNSWQSVRKEFHRRSSTVASTCLRVYQPICIFCEKSKYLSKSNSRETLVQCAELRSDQAVRQAAVQTGDDKMIAIVSRDLVAAEGHYHRSCYRLYTKPAKSSQASSSDAAQGTSDSFDPAQSYAETEELCYDKLFHFIRDVVFEKPQVVRMTDLTKKLIDRLLESGLGLEEVKTSTKKHIHRKLKNEFEEGINMLPDEKGKLLVYPANLSLTDLVKENQRLKEELRIFKEDTLVMGTMTKNVSVMIRNDVNGIDVTLPWPPVPAELKNAADFIPDSLKTFLRMLLSGETDPSAPISARVHRLVESLGQDIVYGITCGKVKTPKHILLPYAVKSLTGCVELIRILNRSGHGVSYSQVEEIETALCLNKLALQNEGSVALPECIQPNVQVTLAFDNIDRLEETLSGGGTSHRVNGIVVQAKCYGPDPLKQSQNKPKRKDRTIEFIQTHLPIYNAGVRVGPPPRGYVDVDDREIKHTVYKKTLLWLITRLHCAGNQTVGSWTGFNILVRDKIDVTADVMGYLPTINAPATQLSTVHEVLLQSQKIRTSLSLESIVVVFDQALYAKATEIIWKKNDTFREIVPRLGVFHTICTLLSVIGKRFEDAGLNDLCIESGVIAEGSVRGVLDGKKYNRAVRFHKLLYEAQQRLAFKGFEKWMASKESLGLNMEDITADTANGFYENISEETFTEKLRNPAFLTLADHFQQYRNHLSQDGGELASFWITHIDLVEIMLNLLRSSREANWSLHLSAIHDMIPWCFAYDRQNYARYLSSYYAEMTNLGEEHPDVLAFLESCGFSVQLGSENPFGRIPVDQTIEETVNKDTQTPGGTKGFSLKPGAISRHYLTAEYRSSFLRLLRDTMGNRNTPFRHPDLGQTRINKDENDVKALIDMLESNWTNPFNAPSDLASLSTGMAAPADIATDLIEARNLGAAAYKLFRQERLEENPPKKGFFDPLPRQKLKTFSDLKVKKTYKAGGRQIIMKADRNLFAKMILISQTRKLDMKDVLSHRLGPIPWALATPEGTLRKTSKPTLAKRLKKDLSPEESISENSACIIDGMALVQKLDANHISFKDVSKTILSMVLREGAACMRIDVVFDVYRDESIKNAERINRGSLSGISFRTIAPGHRIKQWRNFLCNSENKNHLIEFLVNDWGDVEQRKRLTGKYLFVTVGETLGLGIGSKNRTAVYREPN